MGHISSDKYVVTEIGVNPERLMEIILILRAGKTCALNACDQAGKPVRGRIVATHPELCRVTLIA
jgi:hypothetical protein